MKSFRKVPTPTRNSSLMLLMTAAIAIMTITLISNSLVSSLDVFAAKKSPRDICKINQNKCGCENNIEELTANCCTIDDKGNIHCEYCDIDLKTGDYVNCKTPVKSSNQADLPGNVTIGGTFEQEEGEEEHNFDKGSGLDNTTIPTTTGTFNEDSDSNN